MSESVYILITTYFYLGLEGIFFTLLLILTVKLSTDNVVKVLAFNMDGAQRDNTWIEYSEVPVKVSGDYTLCLRFNVWVFRLLTAVIYILNSLDYDEDRKSDWEFCLHRNL